MWRTKAGYSFWFWFSYSRKMQRVFEAIQHNEWKRCNSKRTLINCNLFKATSYKRLWQMPYKIKLFVVDSVEEIRCVLFFSHPIQCQTSFTLNFSTEEDEKEEENGTELRKRKWKKVWELILYSNRFNLYVFPPKNKWRIF